MHGGKALGRKALGTGQANYKEIIEKISKKWLI